MSDRQTIPELLAPAGDWEAMRAAVANGADAVYFGLSAFNARYRAANFTLEELNEVINYLHSHNVRGYVTFNVLIFSDELDEAVRFLRQIAEAGADAIIVQDLGLAALARRVCPDLAVHGSTQMTLTENLGVEFVRKLGVSRVILARELSTTDIKTIAGVTPMPLEVFVHGALCISYSGQCLTSEALGGRSANRGQCAQACRLAYDLIVDGTHRDLGDRAYLLSPQDLAAFDLTADLADLGVSCLKIEGRLKSAQYVAAATQTYRAALDAKAKAVAFVPTDQQRHDLAQSFSRGFTHGFFDGVNHQELVHARFPKSRGVRAGLVVGRTADALLVRLAPKVTLKIGDGIVLDEGHPDQDEQGGRIFNVVPQGRDVVAVTFQRGDVNLSAVMEQCIVWKTDDPEVRKRLEHSYSRDRVVNRVAIDADVTARAGAALVIDVCDQQGHRAKVRWDGPLQEARKFPLTRELFREQFGRLGQTPFELGEIRVEGDAAKEFAAVMAPKSVLNDLRRQAVEELLKHRAARHAIAQPDALVAMRREAAANVAPERPATTQLHVLARTMEQLQAVVELESPAMVYCEFEDIRRYPDAVKLARAAGVKIGLATIRVVKPHEHGLLRQVAACEPDAILVRNLAGLSYFREHHPEIPLIADYALNVSNELTASLLAEAGVTRMTPSYDLNWKQLVALLGRFSPAWFEAVIHQHMPMFHMEHCVFAHTLSNGKDYRDCGRPCEKHQVDLKDRAGARHPLLADVGCRNTVYNGTAQSAAEFVPRLREIGVSHFRLELLRESAAEAKAMVERYAGVVAGREDGKQTWRALRVLNQLGVTRGTLE